MGKDSDRPPSARTTKEYEYVFTKRIDNSWNVYFVYADLNDLFKSISRSYFMSFKEVFKEVF